MGPARMRESLTTTPGIREQPRPKADIERAFRNGWYEASPNPFPNAGPSRYDDVSGLGEGIHT